MLLFFYFTIRSLGKFCNWAENIQIFTFKGVLKPNNFFYFLIVCAYDCVCYVKYCVLYVIWNDNYYFISKHISHETFFYNQHVCYKSTKIVRSLSFNFCWIFPNRKQVNRFRVSVSKESSLFLRSYVNSCPTRERIIRKQLSQLDPRGQSKASVSQPPFVTHSGQVNFCWSNNNDTHTHTLTHTSIEWHISNLQAHCTIRRL